MGRTFGLPVAAEHRTAPGRVTAHFDGTRAVHLPYGQGPIMVVWPFFDRGAT